jgi:hypothetical protein
MYPQVDTSIINTSPCPILKLIGVLTDYYRGVVTYTNGYKKFIGVRSALHPTVMMTMMMDEYSLHQVKQPINTVVIRRVR